MHLKYYSSNGLNDFIKNYDVTLKKRTIEWTLTETNYTYKYITDYEYNVLRWEHWEHCKDGITRLSSYKNVQEEAV